MLSIDIGSKKVCVAEGICRNTTVTINSFAEIEYENEVVVNGIISDRPALSFLINEIIKTNHMKSKSAVITVNSSDIIARELKLPNVKLPELKMIASSEMSRIIGESGGYVTDFVVTGETNEKLNNVVAYAVPVELVEGYYTLLKELKLTPVALDIHANAISKLLSGTSINGQSPEDGNIIVLDIGFSKMSFHGFSGGVSRFNRTDISPVQEFVREMGSLTRSDIAREQLSKLDLSPDFEHESLVVSDTCKYFLYRLSEEIQKYVQYLIMNSEEKTIGKIYIYGGISNVKGIDEALSNSLKIPVETIQSVGRLTLPSGTALTGICNAAGALIRL